MNGRNLFCTGAAAAAFASLLSVPAGSAWAQGQPDLAGTWMLVSSVTEKDGVRTDQYGPGATGALSLDPAGRFMLTIIGPNLPRFASGSRASGSADENRAVVAGSIAMVGTYAVNPADKTLTFKVERATFPNWDGTEQKRLLSEVSQDELKYVTPTASSGGVGTVTWRRAR
ncbi:lipocalin-like domain-containing protein [Variovorax sp. YR216]|uniref:lipocalin-like domain-containing protein n=1 Tax=Variovorax sp. YR216 TaxID=1882828 RepID=UPI000899645B|nr:lipocalin-like domain-containing protein [Variovorax sp. YR216]SEB16113.1 Lipocalin-like domain-containing protein [Variovorax sp. YR216]